MKKIREKFGERQGKFGARIGVPEPTMARWEIGTAFPPPKRIRQTIEKLVSIGVDKNEAKNAFRRMLERVMSENAEDEK